MSRISEPMMLAGLAVFDPSEKDEVATIAAIYQAMNEQRLSDLRAKREQRKNKAPLELTLAPPTGRWMNGARTQRAKKVRGS